MTSGWLLPTLLISVSVALVGAVALHKLWRRQVLARAAEELGLTYSEGDPLGLGRSLGADVSETIWGRFEGADVAVATASRPSSTNKAAWQTTPVGVSLTIKVVRGLEVAQQAAGPSARVGLMRDGRLSVRERLPQQRTTSSTVLNPGGLPDLLHATARATRSQYW